MEGKDAPPITVSETVTVDKYEGDPSEGRLFERVTIHPGGHVETEYFDAKEGS